MREKVLKSLRERNKALANHVFHLGHQLEVWVYITYSPGSQAAAVKNGITKDRDNFFKILETSTYSSVIIGIYSLLNASKEYLTTTSKNLHCLITGKKKRERDCVEINRQRDQLLIRIQSHLKTRRDRTVAHLDKKYIIDITKINSDAPIDFENLRESLQLINRILIWHRDRILKVQEETPLFPGDGTEGIKTIFKELLVLSELKDNHDSVYDEIRRVRQSDLELLDLNVRQRNP
jgi:hypothetical protein